MTVDPFIEAEESQATACRTPVGCSRSPSSAYYQRRNGFPSRRDVTDAELLERSRHPHRVQGHLWRPADPQGALHRHVACGKRKVTRLMRQAGLEGRCKKRWRKTTVADPDAEAAKDLVQRHFGPCKEIDRRYVGDITYIATWEGWAYLATVIDLASRRVVGWALADHMRTELVTDALTMAFANRHQRGRHLPLRPGLSVHGGDFAELARANGVVLSVGRKGECWDNAVAESFFATIKRELIDTRAWPTRAGLRRAVFEYIEGWYNTRRLHSTLGYLSPAQYEAVHHNADRQAA